MKEKQQNFIVKELSIYQLKLFIKQNQTVKVVYLLDYR